MVTRGTARLDGGRSLGVGGVEWIGAHANLELANATTDGLEALLIAIW